MKCKYRVRWFSSKGAFLVLSWTLLVSVVMQSLLSIMASASNLPLPEDQTAFYWLAVIPVSGVILSAPLCGWLADAKFGNYRVFRFGTVLLFISTVMICLFLIFEALFSESSNVLKWIHLCLAISLFLVGACACFVTALPLGLDQMPDASSSNIASYIAWFVCCLFVGYYICVSLYQRLQKCFIETSYSLDLVWGLFSTLCMSIVLVSNFLFTPKWLIIEPKSPQSLKTIYRVVKFAAKHKAPLNRSALTYWEEDIPSRMDLGKSKYGGPFTTEQVEDVKTSLRLLVIGLAFLYIVFSCTLFSNGVGDYGDTTSALKLPLCTEHIITLFTSNSCFYALLGTLAYEFVIYPLVRNKLPSILKRIATVLLLLLLVSFLCFILRLAHYLSHSNEITTEWIVRSLFFSTNGVLSQVLLTAVVEFMCAQSPYNMRGLFLSLLIPLCLLSSSVGWIVNNVLFNDCSQKLCPLIPLAVKTVACLIGFLLFCVVARWYKRRVRDEDYSPQRVVEEVYDRYLTAAAAHSSRYDTRATPET